MSTTGIVAPTTRILDVGNELKRLGIVLEVTVENMEKGDTESHERLQHKVNTAQSRYRDSLAQSLRWERKTRLFTSLFIIALCGFTSASIALFSIWIGGSP